MIKSIYKKIIAVLLLVGPGIFAVGHTIGTGSVTSMTKAGSQFGMQLLWVLALSCLFAWVLMEASGRFALVSGETAVHGCLRHIPGGKWLSIVMAVSVVIGQWCCLFGLVGLSSNLLYEGVRFFIPSLQENNYWAVLLIAIGLMGTMYALLWNGTYSRFEKVLVFFVTFLGISFIISMFIVLPPPEQIVQGLIPRIPKVPGAYLMVAAFVGTTFAAPTFVVRPLLLLGKGWDKTNLLQQRRDAAVAAVMLFIVSGAVMTCAAGSLFVRGIEINRILDMVYSLEPVAGRYAVALFLTGAISAGLSSIFPICMIAPLMIGDYRSGKFEIRPRLFRILSAAACLIGLTVPVLGANPISVQIATQVSQVFVLPLVIGIFTVLVNRRSLMGEHKAGWILNTGLISAFIFSLIMSAAGINGLIEFFQGNGQL